MANSNLQKMSQIPVPRPLLFFPNKTKKHSKNQGVEGEAGCSLPLCDESTYEETNNNIIRSTELTKYYLAPFIKHVLFIEEEELFANAPSSRWAH